MVPWTYMPSLNDSEKALDIEQYAHYYLQNCMGKKVHVNNRLSGQPLIDS